MKLSKAFKNNCNAANAIDIALQQIAIHERQVKDLTDSIINLIRAIGKSDEADKYEFNQIYQVINLINEDFKSLKDTFSIRTGQLSPDELMNKVYDLIAMVAQRFENLGKNLDQLEKYILERYKMNVNSSTIKSFLGKINTSINIINQIIYDLNTLHGIAFK